MQLPAMIWVAIGFMPWVLFWIFTGLGMAHTAVLTGLATALALNMARCRRRNFKTLEVATLVFFALHALCTLGLGADFFTRYGALLTGLLLAGIAWGTLAAGSPFTYQYARDEWDPVFWDDPYFRLINNIITAVWGAIFSLRAGLAALALWHPDAVAQRFWLSSLLPNAGLALGVIFSCRFPEWFLRQGARRELARLTPYKWPPPQFNPPRAEPEADRHDVIVIGAGIGGLSAAALLAQRGRRVTVFEQHALAGGYCTSWTRKVRQGAAEHDYVFDAGVHDVSGLGEKGPVRNLLRRLDIEHAVDWRPMQHEYIAAGLRFKVPPGPEGLAGKLAELFPDEQARLREFFAAMHGIYRDLYTHTETTGGVPRPPATIEDMLQYPRQHPHAFKWRDVPFDKMLARYCHDARLRKILELATGYLGDDPSKLTVDAMAPIFGYYFDGGYYPAGGARKFADALVRVIEDRGGTVRCRAPVKRLLIEHGRARGVELADGRRHYAGAIISNADVRRTFLELAGRQHLPDDFARQVTELQPSTSAFMVSLGIDCVPDLAPVVMTEDIGIMAPSLADAGLAPPGHAAIQIIRLAPHAEAATWDRRAAGYAARKRAAGDALIKQAGQVIPDLTRHIVYRQASTPATFARYTGATGGAIYGPAFGQQLPPMQSPIERLYLAGAGTSPGAGIEAVVISGTLAADAIDPA